MTAVNYIVYDASGQIKRTGQCPAQMLQKQCGPGEFVMKGTANDAEERISDDRKSIIKLTAAEKEARKPVRTPRPAPVSELQQVYKILERLEQQGYDLGPDWAAMKNKRA